MFLCVLTHTYAHACLCVCVCVPVYVDQTGETVGREGVEVGAMGVGLQLF